MRLVQPGRYPNRLVQRTYVFSVSMLPRPAFDSVGGFSEGDRAQDTTADWDLWLKLAPSGHRLSLAPAFFPLYRVAPGSMADDPSNLLCGEITLLEGGDWRNRARGPQHLTVERRRREGEFNDTDVERGAVEAPRGQ